jgi:prepilin-type N-terminal cleavage/methylation domain-containing protein
MTRREHGFSAVELMVAVVVVGVLASMASAGLAKHVNYTKRPEAYVGLAAISRMEDAFYQSHGTYASTLDELGFTMDSGSAAGTNAWIGRRYTFSITPMNGGANYVATAVGNIDGDAFQDILFSSR